MIFDLHNDLFTAKMERDRRLDTVSASPDSVIYAFWTTELREPESYITDAVQDCDPGVRFALEDAWFAAYDDRLLEAIRWSYCGLTHNPDNTLAGGAYGVGSLTARGRQVVSKLNSLRIAVDLAHTNRNSFFEIAEVADEILVSHAALESLCSHPRNLTDEQVRTVAERGGIVGLTAVADFIGGNDVNDFVRLIDCFVGKFGIDCAAIGTDFYGTQPLHGLTSYADFERIKLELIRLGYSQEDINKIFYDNANQFFRRIS